MLHYQRKCISDFPLDIVQTLSLQLSKLKDGAAVWQNHAFSYHDGHILFWLEYLLLWCFGFHSE